MTADDDDSTHRFLVENVSGTGTVGLTVSSLFAIEDDVGNPANTTPTESQVYDVDNTAPSIQSIARSSPSDQDTKSDTLVFLVTFSEDVTGVDGGDFTFVDVGSAGVSGSVASAAGDAGDSDASTWTVTLESVSGDGEVGLALSSGQDIKDLSDNALSDTLPTGTDYETYEIDNTDPTADAGADQPVASLADVVLDGGNSADTGSGIASYEWLQVDGATSGTAAQVADQVSLDTTNLAQGKVTFTAPNVTSDTELYFRLTVTDEVGNSAEDWVIVTVSAGAASIEVARGTTTFANDDGDDLGDITVGVAHTVTYTVSNSGYAPLDIDTISVSNERNITSNSVQLSTTSITLAAGENADIAVTFTPDTVASFGFELSLESNDSNANPFELNVTGNAAAASAAPTVTSVSATPTSARSGGSFSISATFSEAMNTTLTPDLGFDVDLSSALTITDRKWVTSMTYSVTYSVSTLSQDFTAVDVNIGTAFTDETGDALAATYTAADVFSLYQTSSTGEPDFRVGRGTNNDFANGEVDVLVGATAGRSNTVDYGIGNIGTADLVISAITVADASKTNISALTITPSTLTIAPWDGQSLNPQTLFDIAFTPTAAGDYEFEVELVSNDADKSPFKFKVTGEAMASDMVAPNAVTVEMHSSNADATVAETGDTVGMNIVVDELLGPGSGTWPTVQIFDAKSNQIFSGSATAAPASLNPNLPDGYSAWAMSFGVTDSHADGPLSFTINMTDSSGNQATPVTSLINDTDGGVSIQNSAPTVTSVSASSSSVSAGDSLTLTVTFSETMDTGITPALSFTPDVSAALGTATSSSWSSNDTTYSATYTIGALTQEYADVDVIVDAVKDLNGSPLNAAHTETDVFSLVVASATPTLTSIKRKTPTIAQTKADTVTFELVFGADVSTGSFTSGDLKLYEPDGTFTGRVDWRAATRQHGRYLDGDRFRHRQ